MLLLPFTAAYSQKISTTNAVIISATNPTGNACSATSPNLTYGTGNTRNIYTCQSGVYTVISGSGVTSITGTTNQVIASGATGAVTLSLPQSIGTGSSPTFTGLTLSGATNARILYSASGVVTTTSGFDFSASNGLQTTGSAAGTAVTNMAGMSIVNSSATTNNFAGINFIDTIAGGASGSWGVRMTNRTSHYGDAVFALRSAAGYLERFSIVPEGTATFTTVDLALATAGKTLKIKTGSNACAGSGTLVGGTLAVSTTCAATGDMIFVTVAAPGGTQGNLSHTISNGVSFTVTSTSGTETSTFNWLIVKPAP